MCYISVVYKRQDIDRQETQRQETQRQYREIVNIREELEALRYIQTNITTISTGEIDETLNFMDYKRDPIEFIERLEEHLNRIKETRRNVIKSMLDEWFKNMTDNWWTAVRHDIISYTKFRNPLTAKYWSESIQNMVRDDICNGRYDPGRG